MANFSHINPLQIANSSQAGAQNDVVDLTRSDESMEECDNLQRRRGAERKLHTVSEWSANGPEKMQKHFSIDLT